MGIACGYPLQLVSRHRRDKGAPFSPVPPRKRTIFGCIDTIWDRGARRRCVRRTERVCYGDGLPPDCIASHRIESRPPTSAIIDGASESTTCACAVTACLLRSRDRFGRSRIHIYALIADVIADQGLANDCRRCACTRRAEARAGRTAPSKSRPARRMQKRQTQASPRHHEGAQRRQSHAPEEEKRAHAGECAGSRENLSISGERGRC